MANCLVGCINDFACNKKGVVTPVKGHNISPFVIVTFTLNGIAITVGNESSPAFDHHAIIKSFEYGMADGFQCVIEILDEQGGAFQETIDNLNKCMQNTSNDSDRMQFQFGWVTLDCFGNSVSTKKSPILKANPIQLEVSYEGGKAKYKITAVDMMQSVFASREDATKGSDDKKIKLCEAIKKLCEDSEPKFTAFRCKMDSKGEVAQKVEICDKTPWEFENEDEIKCTWDADNQNKMASIQKWLEPFKTKNDKGIFVTIDNTSPTHLLVWEDFDDDGPCSARTLGTYVVNGGECSSVIDFNPTINWIGAFVPIRSKKGGATGSSDTAASEVNKVNKEEEDQGDEAGSTAHISTTRYGRDCHGPKNVKKKTNDAASKHNKANRRYMGRVQPITADLVIQGDPSEQFTDIKRMAGKKISIVFINPFHIFPVGGQKEWLARPGCNNVLSNKSYMIKGVNHTITEGKYVTTLNVFLPAPGIDIESGKPLGGSGSKGYVVRNQC